jgi:hypothetical protein
MDRYEGPHTGITIALHAGLYLAIIMDRNEGPHTTHTIGLHGRLYFAIIMYRYEGPPHCPYYSLAYRPILSHYNGPL